MKPKIGRMEAHRTGNQRTYLEVKRSKIKVTRSQGVKALLLLLDIYANACICGERNGRIIIGTATLNTSQRGCSFTHPPTDSMQVGEITIIFFKLVSYNDFSSKLCAYCSKHILTSVSVVCVCRHLHSGEEKDGC